MRRRSQSRTPRRLSIGFAVLAMLFACVRPPGSEGPLVGVTLRDFKIESSTSQMHAGAVVFHIDNRAPVTHEFVVVQTDLPADHLPIGPDGLSVDEDQLKPIGELGEVAGGTTRSLALHLQPGRYVFFCNLEGHYLGGMHGSLDVIA